MNTGRYKLKDFFNDHNLEQIVVPEIQRDYVWNGENVIHLLESLKEYYDKESVLASKTDEATLKEMAPEIREIIARELERNKSYYNVGFIYAYFDVTYSGRVILIDGQQRLTTLFLLLLNLAIKEFKQDYFKRIYFKDRIPKFDYKVRESSHDFLINFIEYLLDGGLTTKVTDQYWYHGEYDNDDTIQSLLNNYKMIDAYISQNPISLDYIEEYIEFWYFDTNKTAQGEELYIYMNSRGESVTSSESIKARLLKGLSDASKIKWGKRWETWQAFFWHHSDVGKSADRGMEEFLRWIKIIELITNDSEKSTRDLVEQIREIRENRKVTFEGLNLTLIENYFEGLKRINEQDLGYLINDEWTKGNISAIDYFKFLPTLMYAKHFDDFNQIEVFRYARFFFNIARLDSISKTPYASLVQAIKITNTFLTKENKDVVELLKFKDETSNKNLLTDEEIIKLSLYKSPPSSIQRKDIEEAFWLAEDFKYLDGEIKLVWKCINFSAEFKELNSFKLLEFRQHFENMSKLFEKPDDLLRRALLTKGNYTLWDGGTPSLGGQRYSFINEDSKWKSLFADEIKSKYIIKLMQDYEFNRSQIVNETKEKILNQIIEKYLGEKSEKDWLYYFVQDPNILKYCGGKFVCFIDEKIENIYLLHDKYAFQYNYENLKKFIEKH